MTAGTEHAERFTELLADQSLVFLGDMRRLFPDAEWFIVGGAVRDAMIGRRGRKDIDLVVRRAELKDVADALGHTGDVGVVGKGFGVLKYRPSGSPDAPFVDIAWPRTERAGGSGGYRDFAVQSDPDLPIERDLERRDFTVNAMAWDVGRGALVDPFGGRADLEARLMRAVGEPDDRFAEDLSRMLRAVRFACELGFDIEQRTWDALKRMAPRINDARDAGERVVPYETVAKEFVKAMAAAPSRAVEMFEGCGILFRILPELAPLSSCAQSPDVHAEGDAWTHTKLALAELEGPEFEELFPGERASAETAVATLLHDVAKPETAEEKDGRITFYGHPDRGAAIAAAVCDRLRLSSVAGAGIDRERLAWLVKMHLFPNLVRIDEVKRTTLEKHFCADPVAGRELLHLACADAAASLRENGRPDLSNLRALMAALREIAPRGESDRAPRLLTGDDVMSATGIPAGPAIGGILDAIREAQLRGEIATVDDAKEYLRKLERQ